MSVKLLYYKATQEKISENRITDWLQQLPENKAQRIQQLHNFNDRLLSLAGLQLLKTGMHQLDYPGFNLKSLHFPEHAKPYCELPVDFSISHSAELVCCAISCSEHIGVDLEKNRPVSDALIKKILGESHHVIKNTSQQLLFDTWTKKEAIIKAANCGGIWNMNEITINQNIGHYQDTNWQLYPVNLDSAYTCHLASNNKTKIECYPVNLTGHE